MSNYASVLVVDDEEEIRDLLRDYLTRHGLTVFTADGGAAMRKVLAKESVDVVLLDVRMPGEDGVMLAREVREGYPVGIVMVTAAGELPDRLSGLLAGVDDYVTKPFDPRELLARVKSVLRRLPESRSAPRPPTQDSRRVRFGRCMLDLDAHRLSTEGGDDVPITSMEFDLLKTFAEHPNRVLSRDQLHEWAHHRSWDPFDRSLDIRITRLRKKIEPDPSGPTVIKTVRNRGYVFVTNPDVEY